MSEETVVGGFRLIEEVGRGGMGVVWRAEHLHQQVPAAVKFVTGRYADNERYRAQFKNEVETMAALHHEGVAMVFDYGQTAGPVGVLAGAGCPYLAMEWAPGGTLADLVPIATWPEVRDFVLEILDALSHAHARGVVHRDLKPQNVLVGGEGRLKLTDFGLAWRRDPGERAEVAGKSGSPRWMAPEQARGHLRDQGPWTDLYAVGCLVFWMLTYRPPYHAGSAAEILDGHLNQPIPRLKSRIAVPHDIESWLRRLLAKDPSDRYRYAADAAYDLAQFPDEISVPLDAAELVDPHDVETMPEDLEQELFGDEPVGLQEPSSYAAYETSAMPVRLSPRPVPPRNWARPEAPDLPMRLVGAGLGLWGLRPIPLVGRESERDVLWNALREVHKNRRPRGVVLRGAAGTGKSRLAEWLGERAVELGAAHIAWGTHDVLGTPQDGLGGAVASWFSAIGLEAGAAQARIRTEFEALGHDDEHLDVHALSELIEAATAGTVTPTADARERWWDAWVRYVERATQDRPMVLILDDVQWGAESLGFVAQFLEDQIDIPLLFVLTVREEALSERPIERARLNALLDHEAMDEVLVEPLDDEHQAVLVRRLLRLDEGLAAEVVARSAGNPLFAVQLTDDWVHRGKLEVDEAGFRLVEGTHAELPDQLRKVWNSRFERFLATCEAREEVRDAIEIGAALGQAPSNREWRDIAELAGVTANRSIVDALARQGLVKRESGRWRFCHAMFREAIEATARAEGRSARWHAACADHLERRFGIAPEVAERHAGHLVEAGRIDDALPRILAAADALARAGEFDRVAGMFAWYDSMLDRLDRDVTVDRIRGDLHRVRAALFDTSVDDIEPLLERAEAELAQVDDPLLRAEALFARARLIRHRGEPEAAVAPAEDALEQMSNADRPNNVQLAQVRRFLGELYRVLGQLADAKTAYATAMTLFEKLGDEYEVGWCHIGLAATAKQHGDDAAHMRHVEAAATAFENSRSYGALGCAYNEKGEWLRSQGRLDEALEVYEDSLRVLPRNHSEVGIAQFNLGLTHITAGSWGMARDWLQRAAESFEAHGREGAMAYVDLGMLVCAAAEQRWEGVEALDRRVAPFVAQRRLTNQDVANLLMRAGDLCHDGGESDRAAHYWQLSRVHWERLERDEKLAEIDQRLEALQ